VYLQKVVDRAVEEPLDVHLLLSSEGESIESQGGADIGKDRLCRSEPSVIDKTSLHGVDLLFHLLCEALQSSLKEVDLSRCRTVGISETFAPEFTEGTVRIPSSELDGPVPFDGDVASVGAQMLAGRTDTGFLILAQDEERVVKAVVVVP